MPHPDDAMLVRLHALAREDGVDWPAELAGPLASEEAAVVATAADLARENEVALLATPLVEAFDRFVGGADRGAIAKAACASAMCDLGVDDADFFRRAAAVVQMEFGGDVAGPVRAAACHGLANSSLPPVEALCELADRLADWLPSVRRDAALAAGRCGGLSAVPMLRLALRTETDAEVLGGVFSALLMVSPAANLPVVVSFLRREEPVAFEAAMSLAESRQSDAVEALLNAAKSAEADRRRPLLTGVALTRREDAVDWLLELVRGGGADGVAAVDALAAMRFFGDIGERLQKAAVKSNDGAVLVAAKDLDG